MIKVASIQINIIKQYNRNNLINRIKILNQTLGIIMILKTNQDLQIAPISNREYLIVQINSKDL